MSVSAILSKGVSNFVQGQCFCLVSVIADDLMPHSSPYCIINAQLHFILLEKVAFGW